MSIYIQGLSYLTFTSSLVTEALSFCNNPKQSPNQQVLDLAVPAIVFGGTFLTKFGLSMGVSAITERYPYARERAKQLLKIASASLMIGAISEAYQLYLFQDGAVTLYNSKGSCDNTHGSAEILVSVATSCLVGLITHKAIPIISDSCKKLKSPASLENFDRSSIPQNIQAPIAVQNIV